MKISLLAQRGGIAQWLQHVFGRQNLIENKILNTQMHFPIVGSLADIWDRGG
jgi:hypothetical protein